MLYWFLKRVMVGPISGVLFRLWSRGVENIPAEGPAILASNHLSFSDSVFLPLVVPRRIVFLAKADYFTGKGFKGRITAGFMRGVGTIPVDRGGGRAAGADRLDRGRIGSRRRRGSADKAVDPVDR